MIYQQKIEWVRLKETHPDLYEKAKQYEYANKENGNPFYWSSRESLEELGKPERMDEIKRNWKKRKEQQRNNLKKSSLIQILGVLDYEEPEREGCLICSL